LVRWADQWRRILLKSDNELFIFDQRQEAISAVESVGATGTSSASEVGKQAEVIFLSLPNPEIVRAVVLELEATINPNSVIIDTTTSTPDTTR